MGQNRTELLSAVDAAWLGMDDRTNWMISTGALLFDEPLDFGRVKDTLAGQLLRFRRFRQRVVRPPLPLTPPFWEDDPLFDLDAHLHHTALPGAGGVAGLEALIGNRLSTPLDFSRPLWQIDLVDNVDGGCALLARVHHCLADGTALLRVLRVLAGQADGPCEEPGPEPSAGGAPDAAAHPIAGSVRAALAQMERLARGGIDALSHLEGARDRLHRAGAAVAWWKKVLLMEPDPATVLKGELGAVKRAAWSAPIPLSRFKAIRQATGVTGHEVLLGAVTGALRRYLLEKNESPVRIPIRAFVPINLRPAGTEADLGNFFGGIFLPLPVDQTSAARRLSELKATWRSLRDSTDAEAALDTLRVLSTLPTGVRSGAVELLGSKATVVLSSLLGPRTPIYLCGKPIRGLMFWVPQAGPVGLGLSLFVYAGGVTLGVVADTRLVPNPAEIVAAFHEEVEQMQSLALETRALLDPRAPEKVGLRT